MLFKEEKFHDDRKIITRINVAYLSKLISYYSQLRGGIIANESLLDTACLMCNEYPSDEIKLEKNAAKDFSEYIIRGSQFIHLNDKYRYTLPRTVFIYDEIATEYKSETEIDIHKSFQELTGLTLKQHIFSGLAIVTVLLNGNFISISSLEKQVDPEVYNFLIKFIQNNSITIEDLRATYKEVDILNLYALNPFQSFPILKLDVDRIVCPVMPYLWDKITRGVYHVLFSKYGEPFSRSLGLLFAVYVGKILMPFFTADQIFKEKKYIRERSEARSTDWIIKEGHWLTLIECKTKRMRQKQTKETGDLDEASKDIQSGIVKSLIQINNVIEDIKKKDGQFNEFLDATHFIALVLLEESDFANTPMIRRIIEKLYVEQKGETLKFDYHIIDIEEFESLLPVGKTSTKKKLLRALLQTKSLDGDHKYSSFNDFFYYRYPGGITINTFLKDKFDQSWKEAIAFIFKKNIKDVQLPATGKKINLRI